MRSGLFPLLWPLDQVTMVTASIADLLLIFLRRVMSVSPPRGQKSRAGRPDVTHGSLSSRAATAWASALSGFLGRPVLRKSTSARLSALTRGAVLRPSAGAFFGASSADGSGGSR